LLTPSRAARFPDDLRTPEGRAAGFSLDGPSRAAGASTRDETRIIQTRRSLRVPDLSPPLERPFKLSTGFQLVKVRRAKRFASWNQMADWLGRIEALCHAA
jgi:hypothetical protein